MSIETVEELYASGAVALSAKEILRPAFGDVIFPPTYAAEKKGEPSRYNISSTRNGKICTIDSVGSQANRMEDIFLEEEYKSLVPQVTVRAGDSLTANLLEMGHRLADAAIRFSDLHDRITKAFLAYRDKGDATQIAKLGPTSLVFGVWDSRETHAKVQRLINSTIRAYDIEELSRSAQYFPTFNYQDLDFKEEERKKASSVGFAEVPSINTHGGLIVHGQIIRQSVFNLNALRGLHGADGDGTEKLRRYVVGLTLVAMLAPRTHDLRQGCLLVLDPDNLPEMHAVKLDGSSVETRIPFDKVKTFAFESAKTFVVGESLQGTFDIKKAREALKKEKHETP